MTVRQDRPFPEAHNIVQFWIDAGPEKWFSKDDTFDAEIAERFAGLSALAADGNLDTWLTEPESALALILLLDQFPRNLYRNDARAYAQDGKAVDVAEEAIAHGHDAAYELPLRRFFYLPYMHAEDIVLQQRCIDLCAAIGDEDGVKYSKIHADIIAEFDRFPHRNVVLGRDTTPAERAFLEAGGFAG